MTKRLKLLVCALAGVLSPIAKVGNVSALEPFDIWANPPGWYAIAYPIHFSADEFLGGNGKAVLKDINIQNRGVVLRTSYYQEKPVSYLFSAYVPVTQVKATNPFTKEDESSSGVGDLTLVGGWFFIDDKKTNTYGALGFKLDAPTGKFDKKRLLANSGDNVWRYRPLIAGAKFSPPFDFEANLTYVHETENGDTQVRKGDRVVLESYAGMFLNQQWMAGLHFNTTQGWKGEAAGKTTPDSAIRFHQAGASVMFLPAPKFNVLLEYLKDFTVHNSVKGTLFLARLAWKL